MTVDDVQARIDSVEWYHEFEFPNGLVARPRNQLDGHRRVWTFIRSQLDQIDFRGKSVLDIGCWDGYWSFYAEERGAARVLATDDASQNWAGSAGLTLAKELLKSEVETRLDVSIYELTKLQQEFDIVLCMGVYYHLYDPFYAFAQVRQVCHNDSLVVFEGDTASGMGTNQLHFNPSDPALPVFVPRPDVLASMLRATYFDVADQTSMVQHPYANWREYARHAEHLVRRRGNVVPWFLNRTVTTCTPFVGQNELHPYPPPFGLRRYDSRWSDQA